MSIGQRLRAARRIRGIRQEDVARALDVSQGSVSGWERSPDDLGPRAADAPKLAALLGVTLEWLLTGEGEGPVADPGTVESTEAA